jgi:hypothetical protein
MIISLKKDQNNKQNKLEKTYFLLASCEVTDEKRRIQFRIRTKMTRIRKTGRMLGSNPGQLRLRHWLRDALTTRLDLTPRKILQNPSLIYVLAWKLDNLELLLGLVLRVHSDPTEK